MKIFLTLFLLSALVVFITVVWIPGYPLFKRRVRSLFVRKGQYYYRSHIPEDPFSPIGPKHIVFVKDVKRGRGTLSRYVQYVDLENKNEYTEKAVSFVNERNRIKYQEK